MPREMWKPVVGYETFYEVSNLGRVRNVRRGYKIVKSYTNKGGYQRVQLSHDKKKLNYMVHRLVADAFLRKPKNKDVINHKDFNRSNNSVKNLEWVTFKENSHYSMDHMVQARLKVTMSCTKYHNIHPNRDHFQVRVKRYGKEIINKTLPTLEEAIKYRNMVLN